MFGLYYFGQGYFGEGGLAFTISVPAGLIHHDDVILPGLYYALVLFPQLTDTVTTSASLLYDRVDLQRMKSEDTEL